MVKIIRVCFFSAFILTGSLFGGSRLAESITQIRAQYGICPKVYSLNPQDPVDVIIPCVSKDLYTLKKSIEGIRKNGIGIRRIIVISPEQITADAEWFDESLFPFHKLDVAYEIVQNTERAQAFIQEKKSRVGWIYQQLLKFYAPFVIPDLSSNVLILDADIIFIKPVAFMDMEGNPLFATGAEYHKPYFEHMKNVLPWMRRVDATLSGVAHHMLFQKSILEDFFSQVEEAHQLPLWKVLCRAIDQKYAHRSCLSEYEMYFNFCLISTDQALIRPIQWINIRSLEEIPRYRNSHYSFLACHSWWRGISKISNSSHYLMDRLPEENEQYITFMKALDLLSEIRD